MMAADREVELQSDSFVCEVDAPYDLRDKIEEREYRWRPANLPKGILRWTMIAYPESEVAWFRAEVSGLEASLSS
jgi:hypothetical protein